MKSVPIIFALLVAAAPPALADDVFAGKGYPIDGDTLIVGDVTVRLHGIDTPERGQACWGAARSLLDDIALGREVTCQKIDMDRHGRTVARCAVDGRDLGRAQLEAGLATTYRKYLRGAPWEGDYLAAEREGRTQAERCFP
ncbi:thermonuclease family protein [Zavarzinia sp.]|uniref:thermonuclease family protein n=1 Tax=Zavarzinia sp. TaxID=2027920 RepID=UPI003BB6BF98